MTVPREPRWLVIHGHFYQPPRENPWTGKVDPQPSAAPFRDWNQRVTDECYRPNGQARILDGAGEVVERFDNYRYLSFDFGPTLLTWLERHAPDVHQRVVAADRASAERCGGHGGALAQAHGHLILPLASPRDRRTQVRWGMADFEHRFGRRPEGMWLPEAAVDVPTLEELAAAGIAFTVLAPSQARRVRPLEPAGGEWRRVAPEGEASLDTGRTYRCRLPSGRSIALFFYDGSLARGVAFERLLDNGDRFAERLEAASAPGRLVHLATDGESYGHHHRHGEMALAWALRRILRQGRLRLTTYGEFLALHPPTWEVEIVEPSSWSCAHGVDRWFRDCGCGAEPGRRQRWRAPLRRALDGLAAAVDEAWEGAAGEWLEDPWAARDDALALWLEPTAAARRRFFARHARRPLDEAIQHRLLELFEVQRHRMAMFASCGWFFADLDRLEPRQILRHAARVARRGGELLGRDFETPLVAALAAAEANPAPGTARPLRGDTIYRQEAAPSVGAPLRFAPPGVSPPVSTTRDEMSPMEDGGPAGG